MADDYATAVGICLNVSADPDRAKCLDDAGTARHEDRQLCRDQMRARRDVCASLGEDRYDPPFDPAAFDSDFTHLTKPNRYFPLAIGDRWDYLSGPQTDTVEILADTKLIQGVTCIVAHDVVFQDGDLIEDTRDWFAQGKDGDVHYCGEEANEFESFAGDVPKTPELVAIDGSFKAGREGDKEGILFRASPMVGELYRQEFSLGNAEDVAQVLSTTYKFGNEPDLDQLVPQQLADLLCAGDCVVTKDSSPLEPDVIGRKYYAPGIGVFLEVDRDAGEVVRLVGCNFDPRCAMLPAS